MTTPPKRLSIDTTALQDYEPAPRDWSALSLGEIADLYGTDKGPAKHGYTDTYETLLPRRWPVTLLEIGVASGQSLKMWSRYFSHPDGHSKAKIIGIDIRPECREMCRFYPNIEIITADAANLVFAENLGLKKRNYDMIIDDGSHVARDIARAWFWLWPLLARNGYYVIEDLNCVFSASYKAGERSEEDRDVNEIGRLVLELMRLSTKGKAQFSMNGKLLVIRKL